MQSILRRHGRMSLEDEQCYVDSIQSSFSTTTTFDHCNEWLTGLKQCLSNQRDIKSTLMTFGKTLQA